MKIPTAKVKNVTAPAAPRNDDRFSSLVRNQTRRVTGVTPKVVGSYAMNPARLIPKSKAFSNLAGMTKKKVGAMK